MSSHLMRCPGPLSRRSFLEVGSLALGALGLGDLLRLRAEAKDAARANNDTSVIFVWLPGGPPHIETYDMKPDAPGDYRGDFRPVSTNVAGIDVCEYLPLHARIADKFALIRSIAHEFADHGGGHKKFLTGRDPLSPVGFVNDYPAVGSMVAKVREKRNPGVPNYVSITDAGRSDIDVFSFGSAYLGAETHPFSVPGDPNAAKFEIKNLALDQQLAGRLDDRMSLLGRFDQIRRALDKSGKVDAMDEFNQRAVQLLTSEKARQAFDLSRETDATRERYGKNAWGQRALMARRLVEAGSSFVTVVLENPMPGQAFPKDVTYNWDSHAVNCHIFTDSRLKLPMLDQTVTALIEDLYERGLDKKVLLIVTGEFGRTPRITYAEGRPGRDHWPQAMSVLVSGGGMKTGQIVGSTDAKGERPKDRPLVPGDLWATMFRHLGIDHERISFPDHRGRPMPMLPDGAPIAELGI